MRTSGNFRALSVMGIVASLLSLAPAQATNGADVAVDCLSRLRQRAEAGEWAERGKVHYVQGAHLSASKDSARFQIYAPAALEVKLLLKVNPEDGKTETFETISLTVNRETGMWSISAACKHGSQYQYLIQGQDKKWRKFVDPISFFVVPRGWGLKSHPLNPEASGSEQDFGRWASVVWDMERYQWRHSKPAPRRKNSIYQLDIDSYFKDEPDINIRDLVERILPYLRTLHFTHVEFLPINHHPNSETMGYLPGAIFSPYYRHGTPDDYKAAIDFLHGQGIGVILDTVHGHTTNRRESSLVELDGTNLYLLGEKEVGLNVNGGHSQDYSRPHVREYYLSHLRLSVEGYRADGLRFDAVNYILSLKHEKPVGRQGWGWLERQGGAEYLRAANQLLSSQFPDVWRIAEDTEYHDNLLKPFDQNGFGFHTKWNTAAAFHIFNHQAQAPQDRSSRELVSRLLENGEHTVVYAQCHDEAKDTPYADRHKKPFFQYPQEIRDDLPEQFAYSRAFLTFLFALKPADILMFQGAPFANVYETGGWNPQNGNMDEKAREKKYGIRTRGGREVKVPLHLLHLKAMTDYASLYQREVAFERHDSNSVEVLDFNDQVNATTGHKHNVVVFARYGAYIQDKDNVGNTIVGVANLGGTSFEHYSVLLPKNHPCEWEVVYNSSADEYRGADVVQPTIAERLPKGKSKEKDTLSLLNLPARTTLLLKCK